MKREGRREAGRGREGKARSTFEFPSELTFPFLPLVSFSFLCKLSRDASLHPRRISGSLRSYRSER